MAFSTVGYTGLAVIAFYFVFRWWNSRIPKGLKRPPGPPGHFLIGNVLDLPRSKEWLTFSKWADTYGDLFYLSMPGTSILFINSYDLAKELFDKRGSIYSDRYHSTVLNDLIKFDWMLALAPYGEIWRRNRAYFHQFFNQTAVENYHEVQMRYTKVLLKRLYRSPEDYRTHVRYILGASILEVTYGYAPSSEKDSSLVLLETTAQGITQAGVPGTYLVDIIPALKYIPPWFPGAKFRRELDQLGRQVMTILNMPLEIAKDSLRNGNAKPSVVSALIEEFENDHNRPIDYQDITKHVTGVAYFAAVDTINGVILHFFYTMLLHPAIQKRAQEELDEIVGSEALPSFEDFERLKYVRAVFQELLRWNAVAPMGVPHVLTTNDVVNGYFVPKGTIIVGNTWTLLRSKSVYGPDADQFNPERFLNNSMPYPEFAFGYGRRACPGQYFGENAILIVIANLLHLFHILPFEGENGPELPVENDFESGALLYVDSTSLGEYLLMATSTRKPKPFRCRIIPRSSDAIRTLEELDN